MMNQMDHLSISPQNFQQQLTQLKSQLQQSKIAQKSYRIRLQSLTALRGKITCQVQQLGRYYQKKLKSLDRKLTQIEKQNKQLKKKNSIYQSQIQNFQKRLIQKDKLISKVIMKDSDQLQKTSNSSRIKIKQITFENHANQNHLSQSNHTNNHQVLNNQVNSSQNIKQNTTNHTPFQNFQVNSPKTEAKLSKTKQINNNIDQSQQQQNLKVEATNIQVEATNIQVQQKKHIAPPPPPRGNLKNKKVPKPFTLKKQQKQVNSQQEILAVHIAQQQKQIQAIPAHQTNENLSNPRSLSLIKSQLYTPTQKVQKQEQSPIKLERIFQAKQSKIMFDQQQQLQQQGLLQQRKHDEFNQQLKHNQSPRFTQHYQDIHYNYQHNHQNYQDKHQNYQDKHLNYQDNHQNYEDKHQIYQDKHQNYQDKHQNYQDNHQYDESFQSNIKIEQAKRIVPLPPAIKSKKHLPPAPGKGQKGSKRVIPKYRPSSQDIDPHNFNLNQNDQIDHQTNYQDQNQHSYVENNQGMILDGLVDGQKYHEHNQINETTDNQVNQNTASKNLVVPKFAIQTNQKNSEHPQTSQNVHIQTAHNTSQASSHRAKRSKRQKPNLFSTQQSFLPIINQLSATRQKTLLQNDTNENKTLNFFTQLSSQHEEEQMRAFVDQSSIQHLEDISIISNIVFPQDHEVNHYQPNNQHYVNNQQVFATDARRNVPPPPIGVNKKMSKKKGKRDNIKVVDPASFE